MSVINLPPERRAELDAALNRLTETLAHDAPLYAQLDFFKENLDREPRLAEWCIWFAEQETQWHKTRLLWAEWLRQAEPRRMASNMATRWEMVRDAALSGTMLSLELLTSPATAERLARESARAIWEGRETSPLIDDPAVREEGSRALALVLRKLKREVLSLFPEVAVWEQEWRRSVPPDTSAQGLLGRWWQQTRREVEALGWGKLLPQSKTGIFQKRGETHDFIFRETLTADRLVLPDRVPMDGWPTPNLGVPHPSE